MNADSVELLNTKQCHLTYNFLIVAFVNENFCECLHKIEDGQHPTNHMMPSTTPAFALILPWQRKQHKPDTYTYIAWSMSGPPTNVIIVCCHAIWLGGPSNGADESEWLMGDFQSGETPTFIEHIKAGVRCLAEKRGSSLLMFSGYVSIMSSSHRSSAIFTIGTRLFSESAAAETN